jgi:glutamate synthase (NADPH/NADH) large chain
VRYLESDLIDPRLAAEPMDRETLAIFQKMYGITAEERDDIIRVLAEDESEAVGSMGDDTPMPVMSHKIRSLYDYFRQQFAQVTNPPIDPLRESIVMSLSTQIGPECNVFVPMPEHARQIVLNSPVLSQRKLRQILASEDVVEANEFLDLQYEPAEGLKSALLRLCDQAEAAVRDGKLVLLLSDRYLQQGKLPAHALLATGAVHHRLVDTGLRCKCNLLVETGTVRDSHHFATLIGYGATAVYPYMAYQTLYEMMRKGQVKLGSQERRELGRSYRQLSRRAAVRDRRPVGRSGGAVLPPHHQPHRGRGFPGPGRGHELPGDARLEPARRGRAGRYLQVRARRRVPHVQPGRGRRAAGRGGLGRLCALPAVRAAGERPAGLGAARPAGFEGGDCRADR